MRKYGNKAGILLAAALLASSMIGCGNSLPVEESLGETDKIYGGGQESSAESSRDSVEVGFSSQEVADIIREFTDKVASEEASYEAKLESLEAEKESLETELASEKAEASAAWETLEALESSVAASSSEVAQASSEQSSDASSKEEPTSTKNYEINKQYGSANHISGKTLVMSIFADEQNSSWDWEDKEDLKRYSNVYYRVEEACTWLEEQCQSYGAETEFVWDWMENSDLYRKASFKEKLVREDGGGYATQKKWVLKNVKTGELLKKYDADNILFLFFFDSDPEGTPTPRTISASSGKDCEIEICNLFVRYKKFELYPNAMIHEIMHCFGTPDLYYSNDVIPQEYVDHLKSIGSTDIMYMLYDSEKIKEKFSEVDAYYLGLVDSCEEVKQWGLGKSSFAK